VSWLLGPSLTDSPQRMNPHAIARTDVRMRGPFN
jgi:hypothetical protein